MTTATRYRKSCAIQELESMANAEVKKRFPGDCPPGIPAPRVYGDKTANELTRSIIAYITLRGGFASRINTVGIYRQKLGKFTPGTQRRGLPDIMGVAAGGQSLFIEVKAKFDRMRPEQEKVKEEATKAGARYFVARDFQTFKTWFDGLT